MALARKNRGVVIYVINNFLPYTGCVARSLEDTLVPVVWHDEMQCFKKLCQPTPCFSKEPDGSYRV
jgi:hypothetical protein